MIAKSLRQRWPGGRFREKISEETGAALVIALMMLVVLSLLGTSAITTTMIDIRIAGNEKSRKLAFYATEAGIQAGSLALNNLKIADSGNWDNLLAGTEDLDGYIDGNFGGRNVGAASFTLAVVDNADLDGSDEVDTDNIIVLTSTGQHLSSQVIIRTTVRFSGGGDQYAQEHYDTGSSGVAAREGTATTNNLRW